MGDLSENNTRAVLEGQNELLGDFIDERGQVLEHLYEYIPILIKKGVLRFGTNVNLKG